jgi:hypothetical protein
MTTLLMVWNQSINNYITETCSMKFPGNELIYIVQSNIQWRFLKMWVQRNSACSQVSRWQAKHTEFKCTAGQKTMSMALYLDCHRNTIPSSTFQCWIMSTIASSTLWCWIIIFFGRFHVKHIICIYSKRFHYISLKILFKIISIFLKLT